MKIRLIKEVSILSSTYKLIYDKTTSAGSFSCRDSTITIGIRCLKNDPLYVFSVISHEIMEIVLVSTGCRFENGRTGDNYLFNFDHQSFENAIQAHAQALAQFIKQ